MKKMNFMSILILSILLLISVLVENSLAAGPICTDAFNNMNSKDDMKMIELYTNCISEGLGCNVQYSIAYHNRGMNYFHLSRYNEALSDLNKSVELNPKEKNFYVNRARIYRAIGKTKEATIDEKMASKMH